MFYKVSDGVLTSANSVFNKNFTLLKKDKDTYEYPLEGWYWFDNEKEAIIYFGDEIKSEEELEKELNETKEEGENELG